jgi:hypothetical protein
MDETTRDIIVVSVITLAALLFLILSYGCLGPEPVKPTVFTPPNGMTTETGGTNWDTTGSITYDGAYNIVTLTSNGTFNTTVNLTNVTILVVAGGGGGAAGGGGAGGVNYTLGASILGNYTIIVGSGGTAGSGYGGSTQPTNGQNSSFGTLVIAVGGGRGGVNFADNDNGNFTGKNGGSGGGGAYSGTINTIGGNGTTGQGNNGGGNGINRSSPFAAGGGGGAGGAGLNASSTRNQEW